MNLIKNDDFLKGQTELLMVTAAPNGLIYSFKYDRDALVHCWELLIEINDEIGHNMENMFAVLEEWEVV